jgi:hypothetical protein
LALVVASIGGGCTCGGPMLIPDLDASIADASGMDASEPDSGDAFVDASADSGPRDATLDPDAACSSATVEAVVERLPVDIIWMVDNSVSMQPAIDQVQAGLNDFAALIESRSLDYRVIMLSLRGVGTSGGLYRVCIPPPLSSDSACGDGPRFFHVDVDVRSTQQIEQFLGTLGQTSGYRATDSRGSDPWLPLLRPEASKTIVVVTDDNARMVSRSGATFVPGSDPIATAEFFETYAGGANPFNSNDLPQGILDARWGGLFDGYIFSALYGWGSETDDSVRCTYPGGGSPPASGLTYSALVRRTGGVRAQICDVAASWGPFFGGVATAVERSSRIDCAIPIPPPPDGTFFQRDLINVLLDDGTGSERVGKVPSAADCDARGGWYYDDEASPTSVVLCPTTCDRVQPDGGGAARTVDVQFGCATIPI